MSIPDRRNVIAQTAWHAGLPQGLVSTQNQGYLCLHVCPWLLGHTKCTHCHWPGLSPLLIHMLPCPVGCQVQTKKSKIKVLRISGWQQEIIKPNVGSSQTRTCGTAQVYAHEFSSALVQFSLQSNVYAANKHSDFPSFLPKFTINWTWNTN